jgi:3-oxoacyl-[acyl-carrier protein] reductase
MEYLEQNKTAVIYGASGAIGAAVSRAFAREGATLFLAGRDAAALNDLAETIAAGGGKAYPSVVDALDEQAIEEHLDEIAERGHSIDISFNAVGFTEIQGVPLTELSLKDFSFPITNWSTAVFLTSRSAARRMAVQGSGTILMVNAPASGTALAGGFGVACAAVDSIFRTLASEMGPHGIRVLCLQPNALPESSALQESFAQYANGMGVAPDAAIADLSNSTMLRRLPSLAELGDIAAFVGSDRAGPLTGSVLRIDCGTP